MIVLLQIKLGCPRNTIRNATLTAAFFAAQENMAIKHRHFVEAIRREYEKSGKAYREISSR
jgi:hypothetical protein